MSNNVVFNDFDVTVEIYDSVIANWVLTDFAITNPSSTGYLRNRDLIQPKLVAGQNITIDEETNEISAIVNPEQVGQFISSDAKNELTLGSDLRLYVGFSGLLRNGGDVLTREDLPDTSDAFVAHMIKDENLMVFAYIDSGLGLVWLPLSFYVNMNLYVSKTELTTELENYVNTDELDEHNESEESHPFILGELESLREDIANKEFFRGYLPTTADVLAIPNPQSGDYAYNAETGTKWIYTTSWEDSYSTVPDQVVPPSNDNPLMDWTASPGVTNQYSRGDHRHPSDTSRVPASRKINGQDLTTDRSLTASDVGAAPTVHADGLAATHGGGTSALFGHVKLSNSVESTYGTEDSVAATPIAVKTVNDALNTEIGNREDAISQATGARSLDEGFATYDPAVLDDVVAYAVGRQQLFISFTPVLDIEPAGTPYTVFSDVDESILPSLPMRFGQLWDYEKVEQVGFCVFDSDGDVTINAIATLFAGTSYTLLV